MGVASKRFAEYETIMPYDSKKDVVNYAVEDGKFYKAEPGTFFMFSSEDMHLPPFKFDCYGSIKKILIKISTLNN